MFTDDKVLQDPKDLNTDHNTISSVLFSLGTPVVISHV